MYKEVTKVREGNAIFDITITDNLPEVFTDGVSNMVMGNPISKLLFHTVTAPVGGGNEIEQRKAILRLAIPTPVLLEMCRNILFAAQSNIESYSVAGKQLDENLKIIMSGVSIASSTVKKSEVKAAVAKIKDNK